MRGSVLLPGSELPSPDNSISSTLHKQWTRKDTQQTAVRWDNTATFQKRMLDILTGWAKKRVHVSHSDIIAKYTAATRQTLIDI